MVGALIALVKDEDGENMAAVDSGAVEYPISEELDDEA